jgi:hypothetical protein
MRNIVVFAVLPLSLVLSSCGKQQPASTPGTTNETTATFTNGAARPLEGQADPFLTQQLRVFIEQKGRLPADFAELARTSLDSRPRAPAGMKWVIDAATREVKLVKQ